MDGFDCPREGAMTDCVRCPAETKRRCIPPVIDADTIQAAKVMRGSTAAIAGTPFADRTPFDPARFINDRVGS